MEHSQKFGYVPSHKGKLRKFQRLNFNSLTKYRLSSTRTHTGYVLMGKTKTKKHIVKFHVVMDAMKRINQSKGIVDLGKSYFI